MFSAVRVKRIGRPEPTPFIIRRDGTLVDRDSAAPIGRSISIAYGAGWPAVITESFWDTGVGEVELRTALGRTGANGRRQSR